MMELLDGMLQKDKDEFKPSVKQQNSYKLYYVNSKREKIIYDDFVLKSTELDRMINEIIDVAYTANGQKQRGQAIKIVRAITDLQVHAMRVYNMFLVNMQKEMIKAQKLAKKNKDKGGVS